MVNNRFAQAACTPFILQLQDLCALHPAATHLRECLTNLGLGAMHRRRICEASSGKSTCQTCNNNIRAGQLPDASYSS